MKILQVTGLVNRISYVVSGTRNGEACPEFVEWIWLHKYDAFHS